MNIGWNQADKLAAKHESSGGLFVRLTGDGDKVVGAFVGDPYAREVHWTGEKYAKCTGAGCPYCEEGKKPSLRVCINFYVPAEKEMKIVEGGVVWYRDLGKVREKYGLSSWLFEIQRHGESKSAKTSYTILPEEKISEALQEEIALAKQHDLMAVVDGGSNTEDNQPSSPSAVKQTTIDAGVANAYINRLKALPRDAVDMFLEKFRVGKVRDLPRDSVPQANAFIEMLEGKYSQGHVAVDNEVDPFA